MKDQTQRADIYTRVTNRILADLEHGTRPWAKRWESHEPQALTRPLRHNGMPYNGVNVLLLWVEAFDRGYRSTMWMTYKQAQALGAQVRKGETGSLVVFADRFTKTETDERGDDVTREIPFMKGYTVFNVEQIDNLPELYRPKAPPVVDVTRRLELNAAAEVFFAATGADIRLGGSTAFYAIGPDFIQLPEPSAFTEAEAYSATKAHELIHWTRHPSRLDRSFGQKRFGDQGYATEELVAELGAAFLCADLGVSLEPRADHATYLEGWLKALKDDKRLIFTAAAHAQRAVDYLHRLQPTHSTDASIEADAAA